MTKEINLILYVIVLLVTATSLCFSKPTTSSSAIKFNTLNEITQTLDEKNIISVEDSDYRNKYAKQMLSYMNLSVYPCDDFYEYACGNWKNVIKERMSLKKRNNILDIAFRIDDVIENLLQRSHINDVAPEYANEFELAKKFYFGCLKAELLPVKASEYYLSILKEIGGFPAVDNEWNSQNFYWLNMSAHLSNYGIQNFINEDIYPKYPYPPYFKIPKFGLDMELHDDTIQNSSSNAYQENEKRMHDILTLYGVQKSRIDSIVVEIFNFLKKILKLLMEVQEDFDECETLSENMTASDVTALREKWRTYFDIAWLGKIFNTIENEEYYITCGFFYQKLDRICEENKRAAANYLSLKFLYHINAGLINKKLQEEFCLTNIKSSMMYFFDHLYMKLYFSDELRQEIFGISKEIRESLRKLLKDANWLDDSTRTAALLKEATIMEYIGRYEDSSVTKLLIEELKNLEFKAGNYEVNYLNLKKFKQHMARFTGLNFEKLSNTTKPLQLLIGMQPDCFYYNIDNSIYIMAGVLMEPVYNRAWPNSLKYGTLGYAIGHEFTHGFDSMGANYDESGNYNYWWSNSSVQEFEERSNCYVNHYQSYFIPQIKRNINGMLTRGENIADAGGIREAFLAYQRHMKELSNNFSSKDEQMPGIDLLPEQLFFLSFAQLWCASYKESHYWEELTNEHTIDKYRVLGVLSNYDDFAQVYNCPMGSKMNPSRNKCRIW